MTDCKDCSEKRQLIKQLSRKIAQLESKLHWETAEKDEIRRKNNENYKRMKKLEELLKKYGRHTADCPYNIRKSYNCLCGWLEIKADGT